VALLSVVRQRVGILERKKKAVAEADLVHPDAGGGGLRLAWHGYHSPFSSRGS
jgi:hypothetical protein